MGVSNALFAGVSGINSQSTAIQVLGDNIANVSTPGFKERRADFADILGRNLTATGGTGQIGAGAKTARVTQMFTQGSFESSSRVTDVAVEGQGFFVVRGDQGTFFTRAGLFTFDDEGFLTDPLGNRVQGFGIDELTGTSNGQVGDIQLDTSVAEPNQTSLTQISANLDAEASTIAGGFDPSDPNGSSNHRTVITVYDSLGIAHQMTVFFTKTANNTWEYNVTLPTSETTVAPANTGDDFVVMPTGGTGTLTFDDDGELISTTPDPLVDVTLEFNGGQNLVQDVALSFGPVNGVGTGEPTTQFGSASNTNSFTQDGFGAGLLQSIAIDPEGNIVGQFSNGQTRVTGKLALANFPAVEGLLSVGNNNFQETRLSGQPIVGEPRVGRFGSFRSNALENSNGDLATQFVRLIIAQRAFQANTRTISTTNALLGALVSLGQ